MLNDYYRELRKNIDFSHSRGGNPNPDFHLHNRFEIYYFMAGTVNFFVEKKMYPLLPGDVLVLNSHEIHKPSIHSRDVYERMVIHFNPSMARLFDTADFELLHCFVDRPPGEQNKIPLNQREKEDLFQLLQQMERINANTVPGSDILLLTSFIEVMVLMNRVFRSISPPHEHPNVPDNLAAVLDFIDNHPGGDLSLDVLAARFYMNRFHLSRLFKKTVGSSLHEYIIYKRVSLAKKLLADGANVTDACQASGFNDYANFIRTFKRKVGVPPGRYKQTIIHGGFSKNGGVREPFQG